MTFYGKSPELSPAEPKKAYIFTNWAGHEHTIEAHFIQFQPGHVTFWEEVPDGDNRLILALANTKVNELREEAIS
jgi:hypothetical protein